MTRSEEQLRFGTETRQAGKARLRKYVTTEHRQTTVPVSPDEVTLEREPITDANRGDAYDGPDLEEEHEVTLHAEGPVVDIVAVPVERVRVASRPSPARRPSAATSARSRSRSTTPNCAAAERCASARPVASAGPVPHRAGVA